MNVLVISGMWPPDVGGPASHAPEVCEYLLARGHGVEAATMASRPPAAEAYPVHWASRRTPLVWRHLAATGLIRKLAARADVVYTTGIIGRSGLGAALAGAPTVVKLTSDPVFERSLRWGLFGHDLAAFQDARGLRIGVLRYARDLVLERARRIVVPSEALMTLVLAWGVPAQKITVIRNPVSVPEGLPDREELRRRYGFKGPTLVFAGRLVPQKSIDVALEAVRRNPDVKLLLAGEGPYHDRLLRLARELGVEGRAPFLGPQPRRTVFELLRAADAALLSSSWENFPHMAVEALAVGTPVIATDAGGVTEIVRDEWNGLLVPIRDPEALSGAIRRYLDEPALQERLRAATVGSIMQFDPETTYGQLEQELVDVAEGTMKPRVLLVGRTRYRLPLNDALRRKFDALAEEVDPRVLASSADSSRGDETFTLVPRLPVLDGAAFWALLPLRVAWQLRRRPTDAVLAQGPYDAAAAIVGRTLARSRARLIVDVHGDWRTATRLYGSPLRRLLSPLGDRLSAAALRRADAVRVVSGYTERLVREVGLDPAGSFPAFMDLDPFLAEPPAPFPARPQALFVGVLEPYKGIDVLAEAWRLARPGATLRIVGSGSRASVVEGLGVQWDRRLAPAEVARALDESTVLVLPSRSEGMGRVIVEAQCRGRPVIGSRVGGIPDLVRDGENGLLVEPEDPQALADALVRVLSDPELTVRLGAEARAGVRLGSPENWASELRLLLEETLLHSER